LYVSGFLVLLRGLCFLHPEIGCLWFFFPLLFARLTRLELAQAVSLRTAKSIRRFSRNPCPTFVSALLTKISDSATYDGCYDFVSLSITRKKYFIMLIALVPDLPFSNAVPVAASMPSLS